MSKRTLEEVVARHVADAGAGRVLLIGPVPLHDAAPDAGRCQRAGIENCLDPPASGGARFALAVLVGVLEALPPQEGDRLIGSLRDVHARRLLVAVPAGDDRWPLDRMLALGLEAAGEAAGDDGPLALFAFDIDRYKRTPDWLNARHWANPELWGRYRW